MRSAGCAAVRRDSLAFLVVTTPAPPIASRPNYLPTLAGVSAGWRPPPPLEAAKGTVVRAVVSLAQARPCYVAGFSRAART